MIREELLDKLLKKTRIIDNINDYNNNTKRNQYRKITKEDKIILIIFSLLFKMLFTVIFNVYCYCINYKEESVLDFLLRIRNDITLEEYQELYKYIEEKDLFRNSVFDFLNVGYKENKEKKHFLDLLEFERERKKEEKKKKKEKEYEIEKQEAIFLKKKRLAKMYSE